MAARRGTMVVFVALFVGLAAWLLVRNDAEATLRGASHRGAVEFSADRSGLVVTVVLR